MKKKLVSLILASAMVATSLAACGNNTDTPANGSTESAPSTSESTQESVPEETETPQSIAEQTEGMTYEEMSEFIYEKTLGEYAELYEEAKAIVDDNDKRFALMAIAEAKLLGTGQLFPNQTLGGNYAISRVAPYTVSTVLWGNDSDRFHQAVITTEPIKAEDIAALRAKWPELIGTGTYEQYAKDYLTEKGYELKDTYNYFDYSEDPQKWDVLSTDKSVDAEVLVNTFDGLMEYDNENMLQPALAESYTVSDDGLVYTFKLREGVDWVDSQGRKVAEVCADDFVAGMQHLLDAAGGLEWLVDGLIVNASGYISGEITDFSEVGVKAVDEYTVEYTLENPAPYFMTMLGYSVFAPMSRTYYESMGGKFGAEYDASAPTYTYGRDQNSIAYCGPYLVTNWTQKNTIVFKANESYWNKDKINIKTITWVWEDGSEPTKIYNEIKTGVIDGAGLNTNALELAKSEGLFDEYAYNSLTQATIYYGYFNLYRQAFANFNDATAAVSDKSDEEKARTLEAVNNTHFRRAFVTAFDKAAYQEAMLGEELKYSRIANSFVPGNYVFLENETTVDINGTATTFPAGTFYGAIVQAQLDADGIPVKVWDPETNSSNGFDGWYNPEYAASEMDLAVEELAAIGVVIDESNPIIIDWPYNGSSETTVNRVNAVKQSIENALGGRVLVNLIECPDSTTVNNTGYFAETGADVNYDFSDASGWTPDYGDPSTYLDIILPGGTVAKYFGIY